MSAAPTVDLDRVATLWAELLVALGDDPSRPELTGTPELAAASWASAFAGLGEDPAAALSGTFELGGELEGPLEAGAIMVRDIRFQTLCARHLMPCQGTAHVAYLPGERLAGLSGVTRAVTSIAARPHTQRTLVERVAGTVEAALTPRGVLVIIELAARCEGRDAGVDGPLSLTAVASRGELSGEAAQAALVRLLA